MSRAAVTVGGVVALFAAVGVADLVRKAAPAIDAADAQTRLDALPWQIGGYRGGPQEMPAGQLRVAEAKAHLSREYIDRAGHRVHVLVLFGGPGPLGAHTPEVCYAAAGCRPAGASVRRPVPEAGGADQLWSARFETAGLPPLTLQVVWGWSAGGTWEAADNPRLDYAARGGIYKLYVSRDVPAGSPEGPDDFLGPLLVGMRGVLAGPPPASPATPPPPPPGTAPAGTGGESPGGKRP